MVSTDYVHVVSQEELQRLLDISDRRLDKLRRKDMPATAEPPEGSPTSGGRSPRSSGGSQPITFASRTR